MPDVLKGFIVLVFVFVPLERILMLHEQKVWRKGWLIDTFYYFTGYFIGKGATQLLLIFVLFSSGIIGANLSIFVTTQPMWLQFLEAVLIADFGYYWAHRLLHTIPWLWRFHAVHHSVQDLDWLATVRVHPCDQIFTRAFQVIPLFFLGFSTEVLAVYALFSSAIAFFIHSNIRLRVGIFKWIFATPQFHHWHHADHPHAYNHNFAAQLPLIDFLFGTLYMPIRETPTKYGISEQVPINYFQQMLYPFRGFLKK